MDLRERAGAATVRALVVLAVAGSALVLPGSDAGGASLPARIDQTCAVTGTVTQTGTPIVSRPMVAALTGSSLTVPVEAEAKVTKQIQPGGTVVTVVALTVDLGAQARQVLVDRVRPAVVAAGYPQLAPGAWVVLTLDSSTVDLDLPAGLGHEGQPVATSPTVGAQATWSTAGVRLQLGTLTADTRLGQKAPTTVTVGWKSADGGAPAPRSLDLHAPRLGFTTTLDVGLDFSGAPLVGGIHAAWACTPGTGPTLASTVVADGPPPGDPPPTLPIQGQLPVIAPPSTDPPPSWPARATRPTDCSVSGFDADGGWTGMQLEATGAFRTAQIDGAWWLVDPAGHPFFSQGINNVTYAGTSDRNGVAAYHHTVVAKYGSGDAWADAQVDRFHRWGYTTAGAWSDGSIRSRMPYALLVGFTPQNFGTGVMQDLWEPAWIAQVEATAEQVAADHADDPKLVGYWTDNELHFGPDWRPAHLFDEYLGRPATSPGKQALIDWLERRYPTFDAFATDFTTAATSWAELAGPTSVTTWTPTGGQATRNEWTGVVAEQYFSVTVGSMRAADPRHLELGPRFLAQTTGTPVLEAAGRWVDVASFNDYTIDTALLPGLRNADPTYLPTDGGLAAQAAAVGKPIIVSEWGFRAADSGLPNTWPPLFPTLATQGQRAGAYQQFVQSLLATPWIVGQHWFEHADEPAAGRFDGEDSNFGLLDLHDEPYAPLVEVSRWMHDCAYARLLPATATTTTTTTTTAAAPGSVDLGTVVAPDPARPVASTPSFTG